MKNKIKFNTLEEHFKTIYGGHMENLVANSTGSLKSLFDVAWGETMEEKQKRETCKTFNDDLEELIKDE